MRPEHIRTWILDEPRNGHWPVGVFAYATAETEVEARMQIEEELAKRGLVKDEREGPLKLREIDTKTSKACVFTGETWEEV